MSDPLKQMRIYDNDGRTFDRYTVVFMDLQECRKGQFRCLCMSDNPTHPQGFCEHSTAVPGTHLGRRIKFNLLPEACQKMVKIDRPDLFNEEDHHVPT